ncbi:YjbH domain-containing protein [Enterobacter ludwigii]
MKASVGQYLAGDKGGTLDISKHFDSVWWSVAMHDH